MKRRFLFAVVLCLMLGLCACGSNENTDTNNQDNATMQDSVTNEEPKYVTIELTKENWNEYFEIKEIPTITKDKFDDICEVRVRNPYLCLKEKYINCYVDFDFSVEWDIVNEGETYYRALYLYTYNTDTGELNKECIEKYEKDGKNFPKTMSTKELDELHWIGDTQVEMLGIGFGSDTMNPQTLKINDNIITWEQYFDFTAPIVLRFKGTLTLIEE